VYLTLGIAFSPIFYRLATLGWEKADYTHAYFLLPISAWLIYQKREALKRREDIAVPGMALFALGIVVYVFSTINNFLFLEATSFVLVMWGLFALRYTRSSNEQILFPLAYLVLLIPPPFLVIDTLTMPLKNIATAGSYFLLKLVQLPVSLHGAILKVGNYDFFVADACSGYRSIVALIALGSLYAHFQKTTLIKKWIIFLSVIPLGIIGNIFRIFITGCLGHYVGIQYAEGFFHEFSGAVVFLVAILGLVWIMDWVTREDGSETKD
jgi:exosortase